MIQELNERSREIFRQIVEAYVETGSPVGSKLIAQKSALSLSPASIRNVMANLEDAGLLYSPHTSAGRLPTEMGMRLFVDGLLEVGRLSASERSGIESMCAANGRSVEEALTEATKMLSGLSHCAGMVMAPKGDSPLKHIEFVPLNPGRALVVMVAENGMVENRVIELPLGLTQSAMVEATNYLNDRLRGRTIAQAEVEIRHELESQRQLVDDLTKKLVEAGLASWGGGETLIVSGHANLLEDVQALADLERVRQLFDDLETKNDLLQLLNLTDDASGVQIFIGSENKLFSMSGSSMIIAPYQNSHEQIIGIIGVIGPTRLNYSRIIPMVDYTAKVIGRLLG